VVHKTTGSAARIGRPDGEEFAVPRRSTPTPLEQRGVLRRAARWRAEALVLEAMSIRPESLFAELRRIVVPTLVVITNARADHVADLPDPADAFAHAVPPGALVLYPASVSGSLSDALSARGLRSVPVDSLPDASGQMFPYAEWPENVALAVAACGHGGVDADIALRGMAHVRPDVGALAAWHIQERETKWVAVSAFAANDPESTAAALRRSLETWGRPGQRVTGLLNLRRDRGDRTAQWLSLLEHEHAMFDRLVLVGDVPFLSARALRNSHGDALRVVTSRDAARVMAELGGMEPGGGLVFGFGNIGGLGMRLVEHWNREGERA
jgi:poly-gamma-glutamate synthase PgsB/CapB